MNFNRAYLGIKITTTILMVVIMLASVMVYFYEPKTIKLKPNVALLSWTNETMSLYQLRGDLVYMNSQIGKSKRTSWKRDFNSALNAIAYKLKEIINRTNRKYVDLNSYFPVGKSIFNLEVCPEIYAGVSRGWTVGNCTVDRRFNDLISIALNFADKLPEFYEKNLAQMLLDISDTYPGIKVYLALTSDISLEKFKHNVTLKFLKVGKSYSSAKVWNELISGVETKYVLVAKDLTHFYGFDARLERLVGEMTNLNLDFIGGATRDPSGHWTMSCRQISLDNFTMVEQIGYDISRHECVFCHMPGGPFVARTKLFVEDKLDENLPDDAIFYDYFIRHYSDNKVMAAVCPDSMFYVDYHHKVESRSWLSIAKKHKIVRLKLGNGQEIKYGNEDINLECSKKGIWTSPYCVDDSNKALKNLASFCVKHEIPCQVTDGGLLNAVKTNSRYPLEADCQIRLPISYRDKFNDVLEKIHIYRNEESKISQFIIYSGVKCLITFGEDSLLSEDLKKKGFIPTKVYLDGEWLFSPHNPWKYLKGMSKLKFA